MTVYFTACGNIELILEHFLITCIQDLKCEAGVGVDYVLVDRASCRRKVDGVHRVTATLPGASCHRYHNSALIIKDTSR